MSYKFKGKNEYFTGVPARDLTDDEWAELDKDTKKALLATGLYVQHDTPKSAAEKRADVAAPSGHPKAEAATEPEVKPAKGG